MYIQKYYLMQKKKIRQKKKYREKEDKKQKEKILITRKGAKEHRERTLEVSPQALDQSKREPLKEANS